MSARLLPGRGGRAGRILVAVQGESGSVPSLTQISGFVHQVARLGSAIQQRVLADALASRCSAGFPRSLRSLGAAKRERWASQTEK